MLPESLLQHCVRLTSLSIERNAIAQLPSLSRLESLHQLFAAANLLEVIEDGCFRGLRMLQVVDLSRNQLLTLPGSLADLPRRVSKGCASCRSDASGSIDHKHP